MKTKLLIAALIFGAGLAQAIEPVNNSFALECVGSEGYIYFSKISTGISYVVGVEGITTSGFVKPYEEYGEKYETGHASILEPTYAPGTKWLSVYVTHGHKKWIPEHIECMPTRRPNHCVDVTVPGHYINIPDESYHAFIDISDSSEVKFRDLHVNGSTVIKTLGEDTKCTLRPLESKIRSEDVQ